MRDVVKFYNNNRILLYLSLSIVFISVICICIMINTSSTLIVEKDKQYSLAYNKTDISYKDNLYKEDINSNKIKNANRNNKIDIIIDNEEIRDKDQNKGIDIEENNNMDESIDIEKNIEKEDEILLITIKDEEEIEKDNKEVVIIKQEDNLEVTGLEENEINANNINNEDNNNFVNFSDNILPNNSSGFIRIPAIGISYPIYSKATPSMMEIGPCILYSTGVLNEYGNTLIIGHNYQDDKIFSNNNSLKKGDKVYITDSSGKVVVYNIYKKFIAIPEDADYMKRDIGSKPEISISTCTNNESKRIIIQAIAE